MKVVTAHTHCVHLRNIDRTVRFGALAAAPTFKRKRKSSLWTCLPLSEVGALLAAYSPLNALTRYRQVGEAYSVPILHLRAIVPSWSFRWRCAAVDVAVWMRHSTALPRIASKVSRSVTTSIPTAAPVAAPSDIRTHSPAVFPLVLHTGAICARAAITGAASLSTCTPCTPSCGPSRLTPRALHTGRTACILHKSWVPHALSRQRPLRARTPVLRFILAATGAALALHLEWFGGTLPSHCSCFAVCPRIYAAT